MNRARILRLGGLAVVVALAAAAGAQAYVLLSPRRTWDAAPNYRVDNRGQASIASSDMGRNATRNAITSTAAWNGAPTERNPVINATVASISGFRLGDGIPMLNFQDPTGACTGNCLAATFTGYYQSRGNGTTRITDADIVTNTAHNWADAADPCSGQEFRIEGVMVHETGHGLGLAHTSVSGATMFPSVSACNNGPASTEADDEAGIDDLY
ncbi:MAG TPA: matrixin family metalloprotease [Thermoanaerobaculia bacterium]|nr:matrixin family metalloprotease [Thermoanaerobaculia bacterium]